jgi:hypothetical protein
LRRSAICHSPSEVGVESLLKKCIVQYRHLDLDRDHLPTYRVSCRYMWLRVTTFCIDADATKTHHLHGCRLHSSIRREFHEHRKWIEALILPSSHQLVWMNRLTSVNTYHVSVVSSRQAQLENLLYGRLTAQSMSALQLMPSRRR